MISNYITLPNTNLKCYKCFTVAMASDGTGWYFPDDYTFIAPTPFFYDEITAVANGFNPIHISTLLIRSFTKKAIFKITKHPNELPTDYIAEYSLGIDNVVDTSLPGRPRIRYALAKDGEEFEIFGINEIRKFEVKPLIGIGSFTPVPFLLTVILFK